ncbi:6-phosphofructokinase, partial [Paraburkholderia sp. SIMBA_053]|uniref:6-phosphofructokinase n=1 Tax=Paraburkholderia sp. SIMBA_053 TaxID=3085794 RepID=UPI00397A742C
MIKRVGILTSGGDAPGMNAAIRAIVLTAAANNIDVIGFHHGFNGLLDNEHQT